MAVSLSMELPDVGQAEYDAVMGHLGLGSPGVEQTQPWPDGIISHMAGAGESAWCVVDVWESRDAFEQFFGERLGPALEAAGIAGPPRMTWFDVYNTYPGS